LTIPVSKFAANEAGGPQSSKALAYDTGLRVSELVAVRVADLRPVADGSGRLDITHSKTDQDGEGALAWVSGETMRRLSDWLLASGITEGPVFRRVNLLSTPGAAEGQHIARHFIGAKPLTRQGVVQILRRRVEAAIEFGEVTIALGRKGEVVRSLSAHSFRGGLTQDLFAAGEDGAGIALALRWSSPTTALRYARELAVGSNAAARVLGKLRAGTAWREPSGRPVPINYGSAGISSSSAVTQTLAADSRGPHARLARSRRPLWVHRASIRRDHRPSWAGV